MNFIKGYKSVEYKDIQKQLQETFKNSQKTLIDIAAAAGVTTTNTVYSAINSEDDQSVSDKVFTRVLNYLSIPAFVLWINGEKYYFIKSKN